jgi:hypothetical protein
MATVADNSPPATLATELELAHCAHAAELEMTIVDGLISRRRYGDSLMALQFEQPQYAALSSGLTLLVRRPLPH